MRLAFPPSALLTRGVVGVDGRGLAQPARRHAVVAAEACRRRRRCHVHARLGDPGRGLHAGRAAAGRAAGVQLRHVVRVDLGGRAHLDGARRLAHFCAFDAGRRALAQHVNRRCAAGRRECRSRRTASSAEVHSGGSARLLAAHRCAVAAAPGPLARAAITRSRCLQRSLLCHVARTSVDGHDGVDDWRLRDASSSSSLTVMAALLRVRQGDAHPSITVAGCATDGLRAHLNLSRCCCSAVYSPAASARRMSCRAQAAAALPRTSMREGPAGQEGMEARAV